jgi:hypothetical protein
MLRIVTAGLTALFVTASPLAYAQTPARAATPSAADWNNLTDMRIDGRVPVTLAQRSKLLA